MILRKSPQLQTIVIPCFRGCLFHGVGKFDLNINEVLAETENSAKLGRGAILYVVEQLHSTSEPQFHFCCCSVTWWCPTVCDPMDCSTPGFPVHHHLLELAQIHAHCPLHLLSSVFPSIRVFSNESVLCIRWPKYWNFSFSISPSNEYSGLISFRIDWFDLLAVQGVFSNITVSLLATKPTVLHPG